MIAPFVAVPTAVFTALEQCEIDLTHFLILSACYHWANRAKGYRVESYRAERVCILFGLDATLGNTKKYQRALRDLADRNIVRCDYHRGTERTYSVWIPYPERFKRVGTAAENRVSLWEADVVTSVAANVVVSGDATPINAEVSDDTQPDSVAIGVVESGVSTSTTYQKTNAEKESPLNPPSGRLLPRSAPPQGGDAAAGLKPAQESLGQRKPLNSLQCVALTELTLRYVAFTDWVWKFVPDVQNTKNLLRDFRPEELLYIQLEKFTPHEKYSKNTMAQFFMKGARPLIEAARLRQTSLVEPDWRMVLVSMYSEKRQKFVKQWQYVIDGRVEPDASVSAAVAPSPAAVAPSPAPSVCETPTDEIQTNDKEAAAVVRVSDADWMIRYRATLEKK
jgi:hypothetical protein